MGTLDSSPGAHHRAPTILWPRRSRRFTLTGEPLETRQLLSAAAFQPATAVSAVPSPALTPTIVSPITPLASGGGPAGFSPAQIQTAYGANQITFSTTNGNVAGNGSGQTIALIEEYYDPSILSNLKTFDSQFGLSAPPTFTQYVQTGLRSDNTGWALETSLDVEWAHAIAPDANIVVVEAAPGPNSNPLEYLLDAVSFASGLSGVSVVSMSWGSSEFSGETGDDSTFLTHSGHNNVAFVASSGDSSVVEYPSSSPNVLAVGGTTLTLNSQGTYGSETGWSGSGGGTSAYETEPSYQDSVQSTGQRTTPDIAWDANPSTGVAVYDSVGGYGWVEVGGTSVGAPSWAGLVAIADQGMALNSQPTLTNAQLSSSLYSLPGSDFHDITSGKSGKNSAGPGYDLVTGIGSPVANSLIPDLVTAASQNNDALANVSTTPATAGTTTVSVVVSPNDVNNITSGTLGSSSSTTASSTSTISITPLIPVILTGSSTRGLLVVVIVPSPPIVVHLAPSSEPATTQAIIATTTNEEGPTISTHFGQGSVPDDFGPVRSKPIKVQPQSPSSIDVVEPFQPDAAEPAPPDQGLPAPAPATARTRPLPAFSDPGVETVLDLSDWDPFPASPWSESSRPDESRPGWVPSTSMFGVTALAIGGYHLAVRQSDRFSGRWIPGRSRARR
jgi:hypothetical protein